MKESQNANELQNFGKEKFEKYFRKFKASEVFCGGKGKKGFRLGREIYSPEPDIRVGPFAQRENERYEEEHDKMAEYSKDFIENCIKNHIENSKDSNLPQPRFELFHGYEAVNRNARCFIAVEIETFPWPSRKHVLGSAINAVALGRIGLLIGFDNDSFEMFLRVLKYLHFLESVRPQKPSINFRNGLILSKEQFIEILNNLKP